MKSDYTGGPLPSPSASYTMQLESLLPFSSRDWSFLEGSERGNRPTRKNLAPEATQTRTGTEALVYLTFYAFFQMLTFSQIES